MAKIFIDGQEGTTGLKIYEKLALRKDIELLKIKPSLRKDISERKKLINQSDITILCLPDKEAKEAVKLIENNNVKIIDASTAHRTEKGWAYGFPELSTNHRKSIMQSKFVSVPGCHASGFLAIVYPLITLNLMAKDYPLVCQSISGYSGGGKKSIAKYNEELRDYYLYSPCQYALNQEHKHLKEMQVIAGLKYAPIFNPIVADFYSGMEVTISLYKRLLNNIKNKNELVQIYKDYYKDEKLINVIEINEANKILPANLMCDTNKMEIHIGGNDERIIISALYDNLGKGASGAAIQCMNLMLGIDEITSLL